MLWNAGLHSHLWNGENALAPHRSTLIMGILNVTPDSFSDGGRFLHLDAAVSRALQMVDDGAHIIDIGGESTRPGSDPVSETDELERVIPVIKALRSLSDVQISIDTTKARVAESALAAGADIINDVSAMTLDPAMAAVAAHSAAGVVLMHMKGRPKDMQKGDLSDSDITGTVVDYLQKRMEMLVAAGVDAKRIALDPGIGFGKTVDQNVTLLRQLSRLSVLGRPILLGVSRKSFLGAITERSVDDRLAATCAAHVVGVQNGAHILRVHDVAEARDAIAVTSALLDGRGGLP